MNLESIDDELDPESDPHALIIQDFDIRNVVFVVPVDAPLPSEISDVDMPTGSLYKRLAALDAEPEGEFAFVPLSGAELLSLERAWRALQTVKRIFVLSDIPAARYDVLFTQATRQIGIPSVDWPAVAETMAERVRIVQRKKDKEPWAETLEETRPKNKLPISSTEEVEVPEPTPEEDE